MNITITLKIRNKIKKPMKTYILTDERKEEIESKVNEIINKYSLNNPGFDLIKFLLNPNSFDDRKPFQVGGQVLDKDTTGLLFIDDDNYVPKTNTYKLIVINDLLRFEQDYKQRRRFIAAHEYGHYILHKRQNVQFAHRDTSKKNSEEEQEADYFARCFLMPADLVRKLLTADFVERLSIDDKIDLISRTFNVTTTKARQRLHEDLKIA